ncbi:hypothetical protein [Actinomadura livida]|uniref:Secreted protein n=1 Tax=Actinomadura livida TaxID=79909 RepID=A0A7W7II49_9ACTN|nr:MULTISPECIES: hypothetical protein [Actinomadura]MBB4777522.1 hypothetical protein [Actinomadura catellatispora]GGU00554.1 hypothetical protein GCM10010208_25540 [Actinomadura livida]
MRKIARKALTVSAVAASTVALTALPAAAATITVTLPGVASSPAAITGQNNGSVVASNTRSGAVLICTSLTAAGTVKVGAGVTDPVGQVTGLTFSGCTVNGLSATVTAQNLPWSLATTGNTASGVTPGKLTGVRVHVYVTSLNCHADFQGSTATNGEINGTHTNPTSATAPSKLTLPFGATNNLRAANVGVGGSPCPNSLVANGDAASLAGVIDLRGVNSTNNTGPTVTRV